MKNLDSDKPGHWKTGTTELANKIFEISFLWERYNEYDIKLLFPFFTFLYLVWKSNITKFELNYSLDLLLVFFFFLLSTHA